jgi:hypothetical protein
MISECLNIKKKFLMLLIVIIAIVSLCSCQDEQKHSTRQAKHIDLSKMNENVEYSEVARIITSIDKYRGDMLKVHGTYYMIGKGKVIRFYDAARCCSIDVDFESSDKFSDGENITIEGKIDSYYAEDNDLDKLPIIKKARKL